MKLNQEWLTQAQKFLKTSFPSNSKAVLVLGDVGWDKFVWGSVDRISPEAPVPVLKIEQEVQKPGLAANVAQNLLEFSEKWKVPVMISGVLGNDRPGEEMLSHFKTLGKNVQSHLILDESRPTTLKTRYLAATHHQMLRVDQESHASISIKIEEKLLAELSNSLLQTKCLILQDYAKGLFPKNFFQKLVQLAHQKGVFVITDPNMRTDPENYRGVDLITPNVAEASVLLKQNLGRGEDAKLMEKAVRAIRDQYNIPAVLLTRSAHGMTLLDKDDSIQHYPAIARSVFDVTGAGDTVVAVLAASLARGASLNTACILAMSAASVVVGKVGTATASFDEIEKEMNRQLKGA